MKINRVEIKNFRSINDIMVIFDPTCRVLVGINESGKSNILRALALMGENYKPNKAEDLREPLPNETPVEESFVRFIFKFEKENSNQLLAGVLSKIFTSEKNPLIATKRNTKLNLKDFCNVISEGIYSINIIKESKSFIYWRFPDECKLVDGWKKPKEALPDGFAIELDGKPHEVKGYELLRKEDFKDTSDESFEDATIEDLQSLVGSEINKITEANLPDTLFWEYDEGNLLPNSVVINDFMANPEGCVPLKNMFMLAGITDVNTSIETARKGTNNQFQNYLDRIANQTTAHFKEVWKEYKDIEFSLRLNADQIVPGIKEKNSYDFAKRSDGFKRFVTFLLIISVKVKIDNLKNTLLLIDEPDISLHPSGARYLRDELIKISKKNYVVYSTHSIFMVDSSDVGRHYIVKKKSEITSIESAQESNIAEEEVLYNALGYSVFETLQKKNIIFEGWNDKKLFQSGTDKAESDLKRKLKKLGICHAKGVKSIKAITPLMELANRDVLIISDSDQPAIEQQKLYRRDNGHGSWKTYQEIDAAIEAVTGEDFIKNNYIAKHIKASTSHLGLSDFDESLLPQSKNKLEVVRKWLQDNGVENNQIKDLVDKIKDSVFENIKPQHIEGTYLLLLEGIGKHYS